MNKVFVTPRFMYRNICFWLLFNQDKKFFAFQIRLPSGCRKAGIINSRCYRGIQSFLKDTYLFLFFQCFDEELGVNKELFGKKNKRRQFSFGFSFCFPVIMSTPSSRSDKN